MPYKGTGVAVRKDALAIREAALAEAKRAQRRATNKVSRLRRAGVNVTKLDPRKPGAELGNMSTRDLRRYTNKLTKFQDRSNNYVAGVRGQPIKSSTFRKIKIAEGKWNKVALGYENKVVGIELTGSGQTIGGRLAELEAKNPFRSTTGKKRTFEERNRQASNLNGQEAAEDVLKNLNKMLDPKYLAKQMRVTRNILDQMLLSTGDDEVANDVRALSDHQLNLLVDYTEFMKATEGRYLTQKALNVVEKLRPEDEWMYGEFEDNRQRQLNLVEWAKKQPRNANDDTTARPTKISRKPRK